MAIALGNEYDDYVAWNDPVVRQRLEREATNLKKAEKIAETYKLRQTTFRLSPLQQRPPS